MDEGKKERKGTFCRARKKKRRRGGLTLLEAQVRDFVDWRSVAVHEGEQLIEEQLLLGVREPVAVTANLHAAHHILLRGKHAVRSSLHASALPVILLVTLKLICAFILAVRN